MGKSISLSTLRNIERNMELEDELLDFYKEDRNFKGKYIYYLPDQSVHAWVVSDTNIMKEKKENIKVLFRGSLYQCFKYIGYDRIEADRILREVEKRYWLRSLKHKFS
jgi:hypothetical protein